MAKQKKMERVQKYVEGSTRAAEKAVAEAEAAAKAAEAAVKGLEESEKAAASLNGLGLLIDEAEGKAIGEIKKWSDEHVVPLQSEAAVLRAKAKDLDAAAAGLERARDAALATLEEGVKAARDNVASVQGGIADKVNAARGAAATASQAVQACRAAAGSCKDALDRLRSAQVPGREAEPEIVTRVVDPASSEDTEPVLPLDPDEAPAPAEPPADAVASPPEGGAPQEG